jgi:hypothetical protein
VKVLLGRRCPLAPETRKDRCTAESRTWPLAPRRAKRSSTSEGRVPDRKPAAAPRCSSAEDKRPRPQRPVSQSPRAGPSPGPLEDRRGGVRSRRRCCCCRMPPDSGIRLTSGLGADAGAAAHCNRTVSGRPPPACHRSSCEHAMLGVNPHLCEWAPCHVARWGMPSFDLQVCAVSLCEMRHTNFQLACGHRVMWQAAAQEVSSTEPTMLGALAFHCEVVRGSNTRPLSDTRETGGHRDIGKACSRTSGAGRPSLEERVARAIFHPRVIA